MSQTVEAEADLRLANNETLIAAMKDSTHSDESDFALTVINDAERSRWIAVLGAEAIAELTYRYVGGRVVLLKAWVDHAYREHGVATELVAYALDEISRTDQKITIICPVVGAFIARHPEYAHLIDPVHPGHGAHPPVKLAAHDGGDEEISEFEKDIRE